MLIFLDFDGVLRRKQSPLYRLDADCLGLFEQAVRKLPDAEIVITSTWREAFSLERMRGLFSPDISARIVGATPIDRRREDHYRYREVLAYLKRNGKSGVPWVALDDEPSHYPPFANLILIDGQRGFDSHAAERLASTVQYAS
ncbi:MAG: HAD domain-containing protein [Candidatus Acidiferrales bacterium]